ncbi:MAG: hypothetical protein AVDCRST_MAG41-3340, partial [uncultured Corynebacteriales bacterium]
AETGRGRLPRLRRRAAGRVAADGVPALPRLALRGRPGVDHRREALPALEPGAAGGAAGRVRRADARQHLAGRGPARVPAGPPAGRRRADPGPAGTRRAGAAEPAGAAARAAAPPAGRRGPALLRRPVRPGDGGGARLHRGHRQEPQLARAAVAARPGRPDPRGDPV